jgi:MFS family permease
MLYCIGCRTFENSWFAVVLVFLVGYGVSGGGSSKVEMLNAIAIGAAVSVPVMLLVGALGDHIGQKILYSIGAVALAIWTWGMFDLVDSGRATLAVVVGLGLIWPFVFCPQAALFAAQFDTRIRYTALSVATQLAGIVAGGIAPLIATVLLARANGSTHLIEIYLTALALIGLVSISFMKSHQALDEPAKPAEAIAPDTAAVPVSP